MATKAKQIKSEHTPINYTKASDTLDGHLAGIDAALTGGGGGGDTDQVLNVSTVPGVTASDALEYLDGYTQEITSINTSETNTSFVLKPDGNGNVEWGLAEAAGTTGNIQYKSAGTFAGTNKLNYVTNGTDSADVRIGGYTGGHTASLSIRSGTNTPKITLNYDESTNKSSISSPDTLHIGVVGIPSGSTLYDLPSTAGTNGQVLSTNGAGGTSWVSPSSSPSTDQVTNASTVPGATASDALEYLDGYSKEITDILTSVTDTSLVLKPDGNGGVEFAAAPAGTLKAVYEAGLPADNTIDLNNTNGSISFTSSISPLSNFIINNSPQIKISGSNISGIPTFVLGDTSNNLITSAGSLTLTGTSLTKLQQSSVSSSGLELSNGDVLLYGDATLHIRQKAQASNGIKIFTDDGNSPSKINIVVGKSLGNSTPGTLEIFGGDAGTSSSADAGDIQIKSGDQKNTATNNRGGNLSIISGSTAGSGTAGSLSLDGGAALGTGNAGEVKLSGGNATAGTGGNVRLRAGAGTSGTSRVQVQIGTGTSTETDVAVFNSTTTLTSRNAASTGYYLTLAADGALQYTAPIALGYDYIVTNKKELCAAATSVTGGLVTLQANKIYLIAGNINMADTAGITGATATDRLVLSNNTVLTSTARNFTITGASNPAISTGNCIIEKINITNSNTCISVTSGTLYLDDVKFTHTTGSSVSLNTSSVIARKCIFTNGDYNFTSATGSNNIKVFDCDYGATVAIVNLVSSLSGCTFSRGTNTSIPTNSISIPAGQSINELVLRDSRLGCSSSIILSNGTVTRASIIGCTYRLVGSSSAYAGTNPVTKTAPNLLRSNITINDVGTTVILSDTPIVA